MPRELNDLVGKLVDFEDPNGGLRMGRVLSIGPKWVRLKNPHIKSRKKGAGVRKLPTSTLRTVVWRNRLVPLKDWLGGN